MSYQQNKPVYFNDHRNPPPQPTGVVKADKMEKMKQLARCCICFENYSPNTRAPICVPCGHSFCSVCINKLIYGNLVCCCVCRNVSFFGPKELGKNIQLLDVLEAMNLLDPDAKTPCQPTPSSGFPEQTVDEVDDQDLIKFFRFCFTFIKKFYENKQENLITNLAMGGLVTERGRHELEQHAAQMYNARSRLTETLDSAILRFNECCQSMKNVSVDHIPNLFVNYEDDDLDGFFPDMEDYEYNNDPFGIESVSINAYITLDPSPEQDIMNSFERMETSTQSPMDEDFNFFHNHNNPGGNAGRNDEDFNLFHHYNSDRNAGGNAVRVENHEDRFHPGTWNPLSKLFDLPRIQHNNNNRV